MGVEKLIPNQNIFPPSSKQGVETINMTFIETNVEEFLEEGKVEQGRERFCCKSNERCSR